MESPQERASKFIGSIVHALVTLDIQPFALDSSIDLDGRNRVHVQTPGTITDRLLEALKPCGTIQVGGLGVVITDTEGDR